MTDINHIAQYIYSKENTKSHRDLVNNFELFSQTIEKIDYKATTDSYDAYSQLIADYGIALAETKRYKKAIPVIDKALELLENNTKFTPEILRDVKYYEELIFYRGKSYYSLGNFVLAKTNFELLAKLYPDSTNYAKWLNAIKNKKLIQLKNALWYCLVGVLIIEQFIDPKHLPKEIIAWILAVLLVSIILVEAILYYRKKTHT